MRLIPLLVSFLLLLTNQAMAHGGHVGELAGHSHLVGWAAIIGAAGLAAWARRRRRQRGEAKAPDEATAKGEESTAKG